MKKIICLILVLLFVGCSTNDDPTKSNWKTLDTENTVVASEDLNLELSGDSMNQYDDPATMISNIPDVYKIDNTFKSCVAYNIDSCIWDFSYSNPDKTSCDDFITTSSKDNCRILEVTSKALETNDIALCKTLNSWIESCEREFIISNWVKDWNVWLCDSLLESDVSYCKNQIITLRAAQTRQVALCDDILGDWYEKQFCIEEVEMLLENDALIKSQEEESKKLLEEQQEDNEVVIEEEVQ